MAIRNWWITTDNEGGRPGPVATGPSHKEAGFTVRVDQRKNGDSVRALEVYGLVMADGRLKLQVRNERGEYIHEYITER